MPGLSIVEGGAASRAEEGEGRSAAIALEASLARRAAAGEQVALRRVLEIAGPSMVRAVRAVLGGGAAEAEDVAQEAAIALVDALPSFRGECGLRHFGCRIAARIAVRARRRDRARRERRRALALEQGALPPPGPGSPRAAAAAERRKALLRALLETLPEEQAETLVLRVVLGYSLGEVADATGAPLNTVRSRIRLAKDALRHRIERDPALSEELIEVEP